MIPFFVSRQVITGAGRLGVGQDGKIKGFQLTQRADFFEVEVGPRRLSSGRSSTPRRTARRSRSSTACMSSSATPIWASTRRTSIGHDPLVLSMIERAGISSGFALNRPVKQLHEVSHDVETAVRDETVTADHRSPDASGVRRAGAQVRRRPLRRDPMPHLDIRLSGRSAWMPYAATRRTGRQPDWIATKALLMATGGGTASSLAIPIGPHRPAVRRRRSPPRTVARLSNGLVMRRMTTDEPGATAIVHPPHRHARAYFAARDAWALPAAGGRSELDSVIFDLPGRSALQRVPDLDPLRGNPKAMWTAVVLPAPPPPT